MPEPSGPEGPSSTKRRHSDSSDEQDGHHKRPKPDYTTPDGNDATATSASGSRPAANNLPVEWDHQALDQKLSRNGAFVQLCSHETFAPFVLASVIADAFGDGAPYASAPKAQDIVAKEDGLRRVILECMRTGEFAPVREHPLMSGQERRRLPPSTFQVIARLESVKASKIDRLRMYVKNGPDRAHLSFDSNGALFQLLQDPIGTLKVDPEVHQRIQTILTKGEDKLIFNAEGSGKTRLLIEALSEFFGIYVVAHLQNRPNVASIGSRIYADAIQRLPREEGFVRDLPENPEERRKVAKKNAEIAKSLLVLVVVSYFFVFDWLLQCADSEGISNSDLLCRWTYLQLDSAAAGTGRGDDIFSHVFAALAEWRDSQGIEAHMDAIRARIAHRFGGDNHAFIVVDEVQAAANELQSAFYSESEDPDIPPSGHRSILHPTVSAWSTALCLRQTNMIFSGTGLSLALVRESVGSKFLLQERDWIVYPDLGSFDNRETQTNYILRHLWPENTCVEDLDAREQAILDRAWRWLRGRYRSTAVYVSMLRAYGSTHAHQLLDHLIYHVTDGYSPTDGTAYSTAEPDLQESEHKKLRNLMAAMKRLPLDQISKDGELENHVHHALMNYVVRNAPYIIPGECHSAVTAGFARIVDEKDGYPLKWNLRDSAASLAPLRLQVNEPLVLIMAVRYFARRPPRFRLDNFVANRLQTETDSRVRGFIMEEITVLSILNAVDGEKSIRDIFKIHGKHDEEFLDKPVNLVAITGRDTERNFVAVNANLDRGVGVRMGCRTKTPEDLARWSDGRGIIFAFPDDHAGPDLVFLGQAGDQFLLFLAQVKFLERRYLTPKHTLEALKSIDPGKLYTDSGATLVR